MPLGSVVSRASVCLTSHFGMDEAYHDGFTESILVDIWHCLAKIAIASLLRQTVPGVSGMFNGDRKSCQ